MQRFVIVKKGVYLDSIRLMKATEEAKKIPKVKNAFLSLGTEANKKLMSELGFLTEEARKAGPDDLIIAIEMDEKGEGAAVIREVEALIFSSKTKGTQEYASVEDAILSLRPNLAVISLPGDQAVDVAEDMIMKGINVHLFSDHVSLKDEVRLKKLANEKNLLLLGPGAGTTIIGGKGICFANEVEKGDIGLVASAGTGLQEIISILDSLSLGVSHAFGVGGSDLSKEVGGIMTKKCIEALNSDPSTKILCIIAKQHSREVVSEIASYCSKVRKKTFACFLGVEDNLSLENSETLHACAVKIAKEKGESKQFFSFKEILSNAESLSSKLQKERIFIRGVYSGGTLAHESFLILSKLGIRAYSNTSYEKRYLLQNPLKSIGNSIIDMGDEFFTQGRAHPMIDSTLKILRMKNEIKDRRVAVLMFDVILGYGVSDDPAGEIADTIEQVNGPVLLCRLVGTKKDRQGLERQKKKLEDSGIAVCRSNAEMAVLACLIATRCRVERKVEKLWVRLFGL